MSSLYESDLAAWANVEAQKLRSGQLSDLDLENIAEEIESLGKHQRSTLVNRLAVLLTNYLKRDHQPERYGWSWELTIAEQRIKTKRVLEDNPSLQPYLHKALSLAYETVRIRAARETKIDLCCFPEVCPYTSAHLELGH